MFARVAIDSPLPQLDRLFDYEIPEDLAVSPGVRVEVPFGQSTKQGFVIELSETTDWTGKVLPLTGVVSEFRALKPHIYDLVRAVADRQAASFGDVVGSAVPVRAVRTEKAWLAGLGHGSSSSLPDLTPIAAPKLAARIVEPRSGLWRDELLLLAAQQLKDGKSAIIAVPDFRDIERVAQRASELGLDNHLVVYRAGTRTENYEAFLRASTESPVIVLGARNAVYAPCEAGGIYVWDDADQSHTDQSAPYATTREIALIRQQQTDCQLVFLSHSRSVAVQRLVEINYLQESTTAWPKPAVACTDGEFRVDGTAWLAIRDGLKKGPVLVQVSGTGVARSLYCKACSERATCAHCNGPIWIDAQGKTKCRWCNAFASDARCRVCAGVEFRFGKAGVVRTAAEFGKSFPGVPVRESSGEVKSLTVSDKPAIVVSTHGAEPVATGGYAAVVILDAADALGRDSLNATEDAVRSWANAIALLQDSGRAVIGGVAGQLGQDLSLWQLAQIAQRELVERTELKFPPTIRMFSATGASAEIAALRAELASDEHIELLGITPVEGGESRLLGRFRYAHGAHVVGLIRGVQLRLSSGQKRFNPRSGRPVRPITFKLDDPQVL
jgi:primosomal protein N' (replication factor Y)